MIGLLTVTPDHSHSCLNRAACHAQDCSAAAPQKRPEFHRFVPTCSRYARQNRHNLCPHSWGFAIEQPGPPGRQCSASLVTAQNTARIHFITSLQLIQTSGHSLRTAWLQRDWFGERWKTCLTPRHINAQRNS